MSVLSEEPAEGPSDHQLVVQFETLLKEVVAGLKPHRPETRLEVREQTLQVLKDGRRIQESGWVAFGVHKASSLFSSRHDDVDFPERCYFVSREMELGRINRWVGYMPEIILLDDYPAADLMKLWIRGLMTILGKLDPMQYEDGLAISVNPVS